MRMKDKINRAFTQDTPNILRQVQKDCPDKADSSAPRRKRLSDRAVSIISTAASLALIISAVFGGVAYFRNEYGDTLHSGGTPSVSNPSVWGPTSPDVSPDPPTYDPDATPPWSGTEPLPTIDYDASTTGLILRVEDMIYPLEMREDPKNVDLDLPTRILWEDGIEKLVIQRTDNGYCYEFKFDLNRGYLLSIQVLQCDCIKEGYISPFVAGWIAQMDCDPAHYCCTRHYNFISYLNGDGTYSVTLNHGVSYVYQIDASNGNVISWEYGPPTPELMSPEQTRDVALSMQGHSLDKVRTFKVYENGINHEIYYEYDEYAYCFHISAVDGSVIYDEGAYYVGLHSSERMEHLIGWQKARDLCLEACGRELKELIAFTWEFVAGDPDYYHMALSFGDDHFSYRIDAMNGNLIDEVTADLIPTEKISEMVIARAGLTEEEKAQLLADSDVDYLCKLITYEPYYYVVFMRIGTTCYYYHIDACYGNFLVEEVYQQGAEPDLPDARIPTDMAIELALLTVGVRAEDISDLGIKFDDRDEEAPRYWVYFKIYDKSYEIAVHAFTGEILEANGWASDIVETPDQP